MTDTKGLATQILIVQALFVCAAVYLLAKIPSDVRDQRRLLPPPPKNIEFFHFGFSDVLADSLWLRYIQDSGQCELLLNTNKWQQKRCDRGWSFQMLDAITRLAPRFRMPYAAGAISISVINDDFQGASQLFERALQHFPEDWVILYRAAYHFQFDLKDNVRAAELLSRAGAHGAPKWVMDLASKLFTEAGEIELGVKTLEAYRETLDQEDLKKRVDERLEALKKRLKGP